MRLVWAYFSALSALRAREVIDTARGIGLALGGENGAARAEAIQRDAFPHE